MQCLQYYNHSLIESALIYKPICYARNPTNNTNLRVVAIYTAFIGSFINTVALISKSIVCSFVIPPVAVLRLIPFFNFHNIFLLILLKYETLLQNIKKSILFAQNLKYQRLNILSMEPNNKFSTMLLSLFRDGQIDWIAKIANLSKKQFDYLSQGLEPLSEKDEIICFIRNFANLSNDQANFFVKIFSKLSNTTPEKYIDKEQKLISISNFTSKQGSLNGDFGIPVFSKYFASLSKEGSANFVKNLFDPSNSKNFMEKIAEISNSDLTFLNQELGAIAKFSDKQFDCLSQGLEPLSEKDEIICFIRNLANLSNDQADFFVKIFLKLSNTTPGKYIKKKDNLLFTSKFISKKGSLNGDSGIPVFSKYFADLSKEDSVDFVKKLFDQSKSINFMKIIAKFSNSDLFFLKKKIELEDVDRILTTIDASAIPFEKMDSFCPITGERPKNAVWIPGENAQYSLSGLFKAYTIKLISPLTRTPFNITDVKKIKPKKSPVI